MDLARLLQVVLAPLLVPVEELVTAVPLRALAAFCFRVK